MAEQKPIMPAQPAPKTLTDERKTQLAQHFAATPPEQKGALLSHVRLYGTPEEIALVEKLSNARN